MISHLMMDVDGVVVTGRPEDGADWSTGLETDLGVPTDALRDQFFGCHWSEIVTGQKPLRPALTDALATIAPLVTAEALIDYWFRKDARLDHAVLSSIADLRTQGVKVYFATNQEAARAAYLWDVLGLRDFADGMLCSAALGAAKPSSAFFQAAITHTGAKPHHHLLVDDSAANVEAARKAGWQAHLWTEGQDLSAVFMRAQTEAMR
ncbi:putative hydrolase of the HAD superfamily [Aliiroseovarius halocynthiae]|uniref:HAD-IA family hydrolase n=1 Tax=Aliiroseovarius halocynthiae TaxID=985055 RepID=A0A545SLC9_9RHOB|nr:HAD-IA family hydrolase [Aliiroseovarius halocynthiae]TQV65636.1 HAD-IA family hydrolase [Aliiroseovarius halocynthiae]SMR84115.1 putative hydrolase of the HAD superfamily [Aliiroseovarius halocynthiae]